MTVDEWAAQAWPWLQSVARRAGRDIGDKPSAASVDGALSDLAAASGLLGTEVCVHLLTQAAWFYRQTGALQAHVQEIRRIAEGAGGDALNETADLLANFIVSIANEIRAVQELQRVLAELLLRLPATAAVAAARQAFPLTQDQPDSPGLNAETAGHEPSLAGPPQGTGDNAEESAATEREREKSSGSSLTDEEASAFWDAVYPQLFNETDKPRSLGWALLNAGLSRAIRQRATQTVAPVLLETLAEKAASSGSLPRPEHALVPACVAVLQSEGANAVAEAIGLVIRQAAPSVPQIASLCSGNGRYSPLIRQLLLRALTGVLDSAAARKDRARATDLIEPCATLAEYLTHAQVKSLWDRLEIFGLEPSLAMAELRQRADPTNRVDLVRLSADDRRALLNAAQAFQAQVAIGVCQRNTASLLDQAKTWLAQQLGNTVSTYRMPSAPHPATVQHHGFRLTKRDVDDAKAGNQPAVDRCRQALEPFLTRGRSAVAEEWDAYLDAQARRLPDAADKWRRMTTPSPEVCWNLAIFDTGRRFAGIGAYKHIEQGLRSWRADTDMVLLGIWLALQALEAESDALPNDASRFFTKWACEVPDPSVLLASLAIADADSADGFARAETSLRQWGQLADRISLQVNTHATSAAVLIDVIRKETRYTQRWQRCMLAKAANELSPGPRQSVLAALAELTEKDPDHAIASETWARVIEFERDRLEQLRDEAQQLQRRMERLPKNDSRVKDIERNLSRNKRTYADAKYAFRPAGSGALRFAAKWRDERLARSVRAILDRHEIPASAEQDRLLRGILPPDKPKQPTEVRPEIAELLPKLTAATDPASVAGLARSVEPALVYVGANQRVRELAHQIFSDFKRLSEGVEERQARTLLDQIGVAANELRSADTAEESLAALLGAVRRASQFAADNLVAAPPPEAVVPAYWAGLSREADIPQAVVEVHGANDVELQEVSLSAGLEAVEVGKLSPGRVRTVAVPTRATGAQGDLTAASIAVQLAWSWGYVSGRHQECTLTVPLSSWDALLADAGVAGLEIPDEFVVNEPLDRKQVLSGLFQGREEHLAHVSRAYANRLPASPVCFHGIRKVGKSSLLNRVVVDLATAGRRVDLVTAQGLQPTHQSLAATVAGLCRRISAAADLDLPAVPPLPENPVLFFEEYIDAYARLGTAVAGTPPILVIDEFHCLYTAECAPLMDVIRGIAEARRCGFLFAAVEGPSGLPQDTGLIVDPRRVDFLSAVDVRNLLSAVVQDRPIIVPDDVVEIILDESAGHPNFLSAIMKDALRRANAALRNVICANDVWGASQEIAVSRQHMFHLSWFSPTMLSERERAVAVDLAHTTVRHRSWLRVADVLKQIDGDVRPLLRVLENAYVIESRSDSSGEMLVRIRGGVLERYLRLLYGTRLERSPDSSRKPVGLFIDLENIVGAAASPESLGDQLLAFAARFGVVVAPVAVATSYSLSLAGWDARAAEAAFVARGIRFEMPPRSIESRDNAADMTLQPIITQTAEQYNLAEIIIVSADHYFIPTARNLLQGLEGVSKSISGRRVHVVGSYMSQSKAGKIGKAWTDLLDERARSCEIAGLDGPDLVIWEADELIKNPAQASPATLERFVTVGQ